MIIGMDLETRSLADLTSCGAAAYAEDPSTTVLCGVFVVYEGRETEPDEYLWLPGMAFPPRVASLLNSGVPALAHNATFEQSIFQFCKPRWPMPRFWLDTMEVAGMLGLPSSLESLAKTLGCEHTKDMDGNALMRRLCNARNPKPTEAELDRLVQYCRQDVYTMLDVYAKLPLMTPAESAIQQASRRCNARGFAVDLPLVDAMAKVARDRVAEVNEQVLMSTGAGLVDAIGVPAIKRWLAEQGLTVESLAKDSVMEMLAKADLPPVVREVFTARREVSKATSLAKLNRIAKVANADGRVRNSMQYGAAHTGRWGGRGAQPHNFPRPGKEMKKASMALVSSVMRRDPKPLLQYAPSVLDGLSQMLRMTIVAPKGKDLIGGDYSAIEARVLPWLAGETSVLDVFERGEDIYVATAKEIGSDERQLGKVAQLGLGYGMAALTFVDTAEGYGIKLTPKRAYEIVKAWRASRPNIVRLWWELDDAFVKAITSPSPIPVGKLTVIGKPGRNVRIILPSGRSLCYWRPSVAEATRTIKSVDPDGTVQTREVTMREIRFYSAAGKGMTQYSTYGGSLAENVTQAVARDVMGGALARLESGEITSCYTPVLHVHDSILCEVDEGAGSPEEFAELITLPLSWSEGLPLAAEAYRSKRFHG